MARMRVLARRVWKDGTVYYECNLAGESSRQAATEVLYLAALVCEDATTHRRPFSQISADYEKLYNNIRMAVVDAVDEASAISYAAQRLVCEAFQGMRVQV